jgi:hypothetical protein
MHSAVMRAACTWSGRFGEIWAELPAPLALDQACILQNREMLGDGGLGDIEPLSNLAGSEIGCRQISQATLPRHNFRAARTPFRLRG